ncbi:MAG: thioesterase family protein [Alphaproteobacteria bacterium]
MTTKLFDAYRDVVRPAWVDHNRHLNMGYYVVAFDLATDAWLDYIGLSSEAKARMDSTTFSLESHVMYLREVMTGTPLRFTTRLLGFDEKRFHYFHEMHHETEGFVAATNELMSLHVSRKTRRAAPMAETVLVHLGEILETHQTLPPSPLVGRRMGLDSRRPASDG